MERGKPLAGAVRGYLFTANLSARRPAGDYTARVVGHHSGAKVPLEASFILWQH